MSNYKIAVLGDKDSVLGFKALGLDVFPAESAEEAKRTLHALAKENYAVVYLTEGYAAHMEAELERYKDALTPAIILIPGKDGSLGIGMANVKRAVERAVGADILSSRGEFFPPRYGGGSQGNRRRYPPDIQKSGTAAFLRRPQPAARKFYPPWAGKTHTCRL